MLLLAVADYLGVICNSQQHFSFLFCFLEKHNFCTLIRDVYKLEMWFPHSFGVGVRMELLLKDLVLKTF